MKRPDRSPDWADTVLGPARFPDLSARDTFFYALEEPPKWLSVMMGLRNAIVRPFGLKTEAGPAPHDKDTPQHSHFLANMPVLEETPMRFENGTEDKHLTFTLTTRKNGSELAVTTSIWFNAPLGRVYLRLILPGHILAVRHITSRVADPIQRYRGLPRFSETS